MKKLFSEFSSASASDWKQQIIKDLKGEDFIKLIWHNRNGFDINPFYTVEDLKENPKSLFTHTDWEICCKIIVGDEKTANANALRALEGGASGLIFILDRKIDLAVLLNEISIQHIELNFELKYPDENFITDFDFYLSQKNIPLDRINGSISFDPINLLVEAGSNSKFQIQKSQLTRNGINAAIYQNAGATQSFELACALAHAHEFLVEQVEKKEDRQFRFTIAIGSDFFGEIAKLRALRKLWAIIAWEYKVNPEIKIHCETSLLNKSALDTNNNMLRTTTEGMSAVIGGCNSLTINPYNSGFDPDSYRDSNDFSDRMARNQQLIFKGESYLDKVADIGAGSYYIENLTDEIASKAWEEFRMIESKGGFIACLKEGYIQTRISEQAGQLIKEFKEGRLVLVGVNKFQNSKEKQELSRRQEAESSWQKVVGGKQLMADSGNLIMPVCLADHLVKENA